MRLSHIQWKTYKEVPSDATITSHRLLVRAGLVHKTAAGIYSYMTFALRSIQKIEAIIREELNRAGCAEIKMSMVTPGDLWKESGRWEKMGSEMLKFKDAGDRDMCLSPTNEETVTDIFKQHVTSYKQLPLCWYQINTKFRDEIRPRFGLMRGREFIMKDGYSFHLDAQCLSDYYEKVYAAYEKIFKRFGLEFSIVEADGGTMAEAGAKTHEFQVIADEGEDRIVYSKQGYGANVERAETKRADLEFAPSTNQEEVATPNMSTCEDVSQFLNIPIHHTLKSLVFTATKEGEDKHYLILILGDDELNEIKLKNHLKADDLFPTSTAILDQFSIPKGYIGPIGLDKNFEILLDQSIDPKAAYVVGAMKQGYHLKGFVPSRDCSDAQSIDLRMAQAGDLSPEGDELFEKRGIEVGHIFELGTKYSASMNAGILDNNGKKVFPHMGCYGLGVTRTLQAAIAQNHDENGIIWPKSIAPFHVYFAMIAKKEPTKIKANEIYQNLLEAGMEVVFDDRGLGPGPMFKDADLLGLPIRVVLGERDFESKGTLEIKCRNSDEVFEVKPGDLISKLKELLA